MDNAQEKELKKLRRFYRRVAALCLDHSVTQDAAVIYANDLGAALEAVSKEWWRDAPRRRAPRA